VGGIIDHVMGTGIVFLSELLFCGCGQFRVNSIIIAKQLGSC